MLQISSSGVKGQLPSSLANLQNLKELMASGNQLTGSVPKFLSQLPGLEVALLQKNNFTGNLNNVFNPSVQGSLQVGESVDLGVYIKSNMLHPGNVSST